MNHHKTNTLRLEFLLSKIRDLLKEKREFAAWTLKNNPLSHTGRTLKYETEELEDYFYRTFKEMNSISWVEPTLEQTQNADILKK
jgi:hypothetical protein